MTSGDAEQVAILTGQLGYDVPAAETKRRIEDAAADGVLLVAAVGGEIVGWIQGLNRELLIYPRILEVGGLVVAEQHRGKGFGSALLARLIEWGKANGHTRVFVRSSVARAGAHRFYEELGFGREKTSHTFSLEIR